MEFSELLETITAHHEKQLPFVVYGLPENSTVVAQFQDHLSPTTKNDFPTDGFVFAPFDKEKPFYSISETTPITISLPAVELPLETVSLNERETAKAKHKDLVEKCILEINLTEVQKIVASRKVTVSAKKMDLKQVLSRLFLLYPSAFRYVWFHPDTGIWCGASPEILLQVKAGEFRTMSLAGTQVSEEISNVVWGSKEKEEQEMVTQALVTRLKDITTQLTISEPYTHRAGSLLHIRTDVDGILRQGITSVQNAVFELHPTPAVCGTPRNHAKTFLLKNEDYDRSFYAGFLGPISNNGAMAAMFVNLRCMQLDEHGVHMYVGGGITSRSTPSSEWKETQNKLQTMLQVLAPML